MTKVGDAIMENGGSGELEKLLEETHGGLEKRIRMSVFLEGDRKEIGEESSGFGREELGYARDLPLRLKHS